MKVTIIGGGSYTWAFGFCRQFVLSEQLQGVHVTLMDTNPAALALVHAAGTRFNLAHGSPITLESSHLRPPLTALTMWSCRFQLVAWRRCSTT